MEQKEKGTYVNKMIRDYVPTTLGRHFFLVDFFGQDIVVSGDSAGGNLALSLLLRLQSKGVEMPAAAVTCHLNHLFPEYGGVALIDEDLLRFSMSLMTSF